MFNIDLNLISNAIKTFKNNGYLPISVPMLVKEQYSNITLPEDRVNYHHNDELVYVGSAEQSFIQMIDEGLITNHGKYMAITPCVRDELILDDSHLHSFLKIELVIWDHYPNDETILKAVQKFYESIIPNDCKLTITKDNGVFDININDTEVGSYGYRKLNNGILSYGTLLALPRFDYALSKK